MKLMIFKKDSYYSAYLAGISWLAYAYFFVIAKDAFFSALFLTLGGLFAVKVFTALYSILKEEDSGFAVTILVLGVAGALGTMVHGGYDLANAINPSMTANLDLPSQVDPRGLLAFGITGLAIFKASYLMDKQSFSASKTKFFPHNLNFLGLFSGVLLMVIYVGRLVVLDPMHPVLKYSILIEGFIVNPIWYLWLGYIFQKKLK